MSRWGGFNFGVDVAVEFISDSPDPVTVGQTLSYTARITNYNATTDVVVEAVLPAGLFLN